MGNRRLGTRRLEAVMDNLLGHARLGGLNGSPFVIKDPDRIYLEEYFDLLPSVADDQIITLAGNDGADKVDVELALSTNKHFQILGTGAESNDVIHTTGNGSACGIRLQSDGGNGDQIIVLPRLLVGIVAASAWTSTQWGTENQVQWECAIRTDEADIDDTTIWAGLKLTNVPAMATDADQAYFVYGAEDDDAGALTTNANLHFVYSVGGVDYVTDLGITVAAATNYRLGIQFASDRTVSAWVNGVQYGLTTVASAAGVAVTPASGTESSRSVAMTDDINLIPYVGIMNQDATQRDMVLFYEKISRIFFE